MRYVLLTLCALALAGCSSAASEKTPATIATLSPTATQQAKPTERPSVAPPTVEPPQPTPGQPISEIPTSAPATAIPVPPAAPPVVQPTEPPPPPATGVVYPCEAGDCNCDDFPSHAEAQRVYNKHGANNWSGLDRDRDGVACETLP